MSPDRELAIKALDRLSDDELHDVIHRLTVDPRVQRKTGLQGWWRRWAGTIAFVTLILLGAAGFFRVQAIATATDEFAVDLRNGLVESCEQNGNPLREAVRGVLSDQIAQSSSPMLDEFFPQIPPDQLHALIDAANVQRQARIDQLKNVDCEALYPEPKDA